MSPCLSEQQVLDYFSVRTSGLFRAHVEQHLAQCFDCSDLVAAAATALLPAEISDGSWPRPYAKATSRIGHFVLDSPLGHGGMGVVFRGHDERTGEQAAIKATRFKTPGAAASIRREIQILSQLAHPGVVRLLDHGIEDGLPWYAMEHIDGPTLEVYSSELRTLGSEAARRTLLTTIRRLTSSLGYLHSAGVAHRDLSPRNILVGHMNAPVLVDFGFAVRNADSVEHIDPNASRAGTVPYLAPELIRGDFSDSRPADIYAVGCILYEVLTGSPPFVGRTEEEILRAHLRQVPVPPSEKVVGLDRQLNALVLRLLAKSPSERVRYAEEVADALGELGGEDWSKCPAHVRSEYLSRPSLIGRRGVIDAVLELSERVRQGSGAKLLLRGPSGIGKSRIASEAAARARSLGVTVICGACIALADEHGRVGPAPSSLFALRPLLQELAERGRLCGPAVAERLVGDRAHVLLAFEPEFAAISGFEAPAFAHQLPAEQQQQRLLDALVTCVLALALDEPLLLIIDDLQWADDLTQRFIRQLTPAMLAQHRLGVIGTLRDDDGSAVRIAFEQFEGTEVRLGPLDHIEVGRIICEMLATSAAPASLARVILEEAEGNPFFVAEYLRAALAEGWLWRDGLGEWQFPTTEYDPSAKRLPVPRGVRALVERRFSLLSSAARGLAEVASAIGREFDSRVLLTSASADVLAVQTAPSFAFALDELVARQVVERSESGLYRFLHDQLREVAYSGVPPSRRREVHAAIAAALDELRPSAPILSGQLATLGHHYALGGNPGKARPYLKAAGEQALLAGATREARTHLSRALALGAQTSQRDLDTGTLYRLSGEAAFALGDLDDAQKKLVAGLNHVGVPAPKGRVGWITLLLAQACRQLVQHLFPQRLRLASLEREEWLLETSSAAGLLAIVYYFTGEDVALLAILLVCVNCAERTRSTATLTTSYARIGYIVGLLGLDRLASHYFDRARRLGQQTGDTRSLALALYLQAFGSLGRGKWRETIDDGEEAVRLLGTVGDWQEQEVAATIVAHALYYSGHVEEAERRYERILDSARRRESTQHVGWGLFLKARSQLAQGNSEAAIQLLNEARALLTPSPDRLSLAICEGLLAKALLAADRLEDATQISATLSPRTSGPVLPLAPCLHAYEGMVEIALAQWSRSTGPDARRWRLKALSACRDLKRFVRMFPIGVPSLFGSLARCAELDGQFSRAGRFRTKGELSARSLQMPTP